MPHFNTDFRLSFDAGSHNVEKNQEETRQTDGALFIG
jgi:hypothetical protein